MHFWTALIGRIYKNIRKEQVAQLIDGRNANEEQKWIPLLSAQHDWDW